jgi:hypothetical protein
LAQLRDHPKEITMATPAKRRVQYTVEDVKRELDRAPQRASMVMGFLLRPESRLVSPQTQTGRLMISLLLDLDRVLRRAEQTVIRSLAQDQFDARVAYERTNMDLVRAVARHTAELAIKYDATELLAEPLIKEMAGLGAAGGGSNLAGDRQPGGSDTNAPRAIANSSAAVSATDEPTVGALHRDRDRERTAVAA